MSSKLIPYLSFEGNCEEAMNFYKECFDGSIGEYSRFGESPQPVPDTHKDWVMHVEFRFDGNTLMAADAMKGYEVKKGNDITLNIAADNLEKMELWFKNLSQEGVVIMELQDTFWGARFGMVQDKFGFQWMFNHDLK